MVAGFMKSIATLYYNIDHQTWIEGPSLNIGRAHHSCALFKLPHNVYAVIVTGGAYGWNSDGQYLDSTEFLNLDTNSWTQG
jgi:hypothetical protein